MFSSVAPQVPWPSRRPQNYHARALALGVLCFSIRRSNVRLAWQRSPGEKGGLSFYGRCGSVRDSGAHRIGSAIQGELLRFIEQRSDYVMRTPEDEQCEDFERFLGMRFPSVPLAYAHWPNKSPEPTPRAVTPRASEMKTEEKISNPESTGARFAPAVVAAHLWLWAVWAGNIFVAK
jgi:hypothetical protein